MSTTTRPPLTGTVHDYNDRGGYGYIQPDDHTPDTQLLLVHRRSLRNPHASLRRGDRVAFTAQIVSRGTLATDVHPEMEESDLYPELSEGMIGQILKIRHNKSFGFISLPGNQRALFHKTHLIDSSKWPEVGAMVQFNLVKTPKGIQAKDIAIASNLASLAPDRMTNKSSSHKYLLPQAVLARDNREYPKARQLYEQGLQESPSIQLILS